jgi:hypothetical protein
MYRHPRLWLQLCLCAALHASGQTARDASIDAHEDQKFGRTWNLRKDQNGIRVYTRTTDSSRFDELKVETILPGKPSSLATLILDIANYPNWSFNNEKAYVLKTISPDELYFYSLIHSPWPASDRDLAVHLHIRQDSSTGKIYISADEMANYIPEKQGIVRVPLSVERWIVIPLPGDKLKISYELRLDPGASAPPWLINIFSTKGPYETFLNIRNQLQKPKYHDATLAFIRN